MDASSDIDPVTAYELSALRLHLAVGMAAADGELHEAEVDRLTSFVEQCPVDELRRTLLEGLLDRLLQEPPPLDELLRRIIDRIDRPALAQLLVDDLVAIAHIDDHVDPREEGLLRMVCGALEIDPVSLYADHERAGGDATAAELAELVRGLLGLEAA